MRFSPLPLNKYECKPIQIRFKKSPIFSSHALVWAYRLSYLPLRSWRLEWADCNSMNLWILFVYVEPFLFFFSNFFFLNHYSQSNGTGLRRAKTARDCTLAYPQSILYELPFLSPPFKVNVSHTSSLALLLSPDCKASEGELNYLEVVFYHLWRFTNYIPCLQFHGLQFLCLTSLTSL